jgi:SAM-dependent methyltransferase
MANLKPISDPAHFAELYRSSDDPWAMRERWYEARKRAVTLAALPERHYESGFEPGCANGELSAALATRCSRLLVSDLNQTAVGLARQRLHELPHVRVEQRVMPHEWPQQQFDLIVISELAYYLQAADLELLITHALASLTPDGTLLACHWCHSVEHKGQNATLVHAAFNARSQLKRLVSHLEVDFMLDVWSLDGRSVAQREGWF